MLFRDRGDGIAIEHDGAFGQRNLDDPAGDRRQDAAFDQLLRDRAFGGAATQCVVATLMAVRASSTLRGSAPVPARSRHD